MKLALHDQVGLMVLVTQFHFDAAVSLRGDAVSQSFESHAQLAQVIASGGRRQNAAIQTTELRVDGRLRRVDASIRSLIWALGEIFFPSPTTTPAPYEAANAQYEAADAHSGMSSLPISMVSLVSVVYMLLYWFIVVKKYPYLDPDCKPNEAAKELMAQNEVKAIFNASANNNCLSCCCPGPRASHTFHSTGVLSYWPSFCLMTCCPWPALPLTLCWANYRSDLNPRLGGEKKSCLSSFLCSCCCTCCVISQEAEALDLNTGMRTGIFGVTKV